MSNYAIKLAAEFYRTMAPDHPSGMSAEAMTDLGRDAANLADLDNQHLVTAAQVGLGSEGFISAAWRIAKKRPSPLFYAQLRHFTLAKPGQNVTRYLRYVEGRLRMLIIRNHRLLGSSVRVLEQLSRLPKWVGTHAFTCRVIDDKLGTKLQIDWDKFAKIIGNIKQHGPRYHAALQGDSDDALRILGVVPPSDASKYTTDGLLQRSLTPQYPSIPLGWSKRIVLGESPCDIADSCRGGTYATTLHVGDGNLTSMEAHQWLLECTSEDDPDTVATWWPQITSPAVWLAVRLNVKAHRSVTVVRWLSNLKQTGRYEALSTERTLVLPDGKVLRTTLLSILDEVMISDIVTGKDSVSAVWKRATQRRKKEWLDRHAFDTTPLAPIPHWATILPKCMKLINSPADLVSVGYVLSNCAGGYIDAVRNGECSLVLITTRYGKSLVEISYRASTAYEQALVDVIRDTAYAMYRESLGLQEFVQEYRNQRTLGAIDAEVVTQQRAQRKAAQTAFIVAQHEGPLRTKPHPRHMSLVKAFVNRVHRSLLSNVERQVSGRHFSPDYGMGLPDYVNGLMISRMNEMPSEPPPAQ